MQQIAFMLLEVYGKDLPEAYYMNALKELRVSLWNFFFHKHQKAFRPTPKAIILH